MGEGPTNVLVSGGIRGEVRMFHPTRKVCFHEWRPVDKKNIAVNSIVFHSEVTLLNQSLDLFAIPKNLFTLLAPI